MELTLNRNYSPTVVAGEICRGHKPICDTQELPWRKNQDFLSCIPEGRYALCPRYTESAGWHIEVLSVPGRSRVLIHALEHAEDFPGAIVPIGEASNLSPEDASRVANVRLKRLVFDAIERDEPVFLTIRKKQEHV